VNVGPGGGSNARALQRDHRQVGSGDKESPMTPVWVPLVVAAAGVVGTLGGVWLTQRRADRREEATWKRERQREQQAWAREDAARTFENRRAVYSAYYGLLQDTAYQVHNHAMGTSDAPEHDDRMEYRWQLPAYRKLEQVQLYGTSAVSSAARSAYAALYNWGSHASYGHIDSEHARRERKFGEARTALLAAIRCDLKIPDDPGPSAEPTA
jgi:hypothetical protein